MDKLIYTEEDLSNYEAQTKKERLFVNEIEVRYISNESVFQSNQQALKFQSQFLKKLSVFKSNGKRLDVINKLADFLEDNMDLFYTNDPKKTDDENDLAKNRLSLQL